MIYFVSCQCLAVSMIGLRVAEIDCTTTRRGYRRYYMKLGISNGRASDGVHQEEEWMGRSLGLGQDRLVYVSILKDARTTMR